MIEVLPLIVFLVHYPSVRSDVIPHPYLSRHARAYGDDIATFDIGNDEQSALKDATHTTSPANAIGERLEIELGHGYELLGRSRFSLALC